MLKQHLHVEELHQGIVPLHVQERTLYVQIKVKFSLGNLFTSLLEELHSEKLCAMNPFDPLSRAPNHVDLRWSTAGRRRLQLRLHAGRVVGSWARQLTRSP